MVYTRYGTKVTILDVNKDEKGVWLKVKTEDGREREWDFNDFVADNGYDEIVNKARKTITPAKFKEIFPRFDDVEFIALM